MVRIRAEEPHDVAAIHALNVAAFESNAEARLVDALRAAGALTLSLVAQDGGEIVGHIAFSPVVVTSNETSADGVGLAPMAVSPDRQRTGIGGQLIAQGLSRLRATNQPFCVVLGHPEYYPRHGFQRAIEFGIRWEKGGTEDFFFIQQLVPGGLNGVSGTARYRPEFEQI